MQSIGQQLFGPQSLFGLDLQASALRGLRVLVI